MQQREGRDFSFDHGGRVDEFALALRTADGAGPIELAVMQELYIREGRDFTNRRGNRGFPLAEIRTKT